jgi:hypothetical protein
MKISTITSLEYMNILLVNLLEGMPSELLVGDMMTKVSFTGMSKINGQLIGEKKVMQESRQEN